MKLKFKRNPSLRRKPREVVNKLASVLRSKVRKYPRLAKPKRGGAPEALLGLRRFVANPRRFGGLVSGPALAAAITREIDPAAGPVLELGPGTGVFTRSLLACGVAECDLILVEADPVLAAHLQQAFPEARVLACRAASVTTDLLDGSRPAAVVSGLPLLNFPDHEVEQLIAATLALCTDDAAIHQFTYGPRCPVREETLARLGLAAARTNRVWRNVPPASVYRITRREA